MAQIFSRFLVAYFVALPILFSCHTLQHEHHEVKDHHKELTIIHSTSDCTLCDLYQNHTSIVEISVTHDVRLTYTFFQDGISGDLIEAIGYSRHLRGPPAC
ncbi:hypothetical protein QQ008_15250 [Fulvivirgaceae bacterium BMA10]|uniref:Uncharacterized protein n=1 Tax=Splendidivirga corallicola TaxID=3051826 RepID=A0ABT8KPT2_9BACT|nr:hypothetical protein [Fulvivirgaceae bacterium BMA10]